MTRPIRLLRLVTTSIGLTALAGCSCGEWGYGGGETTPESAARWQQYQDDEHRAASLMWKEQFEEGATHYESLWRRATEPGPPPGAPVWFFVADDMEMFRRKQPWLAERWAGLMPEAEARVAAEDVNPRDLAQFLDLVRVLDDPAPLVRQVEAVKTDERKKRVWRCVRFTNDKARELLMHWKRQDLAMVIERNPAQQVGDAMFDAAFGIAGNLIAPIGPLNGK